MRLLIFYRCFIIFLTFFQCTNAFTLNIETALDQAVPINRLKKRPANCLVKVLSTFSDGSPLAVLLLTTTQDHEEAIPIKMLTYYENGNIYNETDVIPKHNQTDNVDQSFELHGPSITYYAYNKVQQINFYAHGEFCETIKTYYQNGQLCSVVAVKDGLYDGLYESFYENGDLKETINYSQGLRSGLQTIYYKNEKKASYASYMNDLLHGEKTEWHPDGRQKSIRLYYKGLLNGYYSKPALTLYQPNGLISEVQDFRQGQKFGPCSTAGHENVLDKQSEESLKFLFEGEFADYYPNGQLHRKYFYKDDMFEGEQIEFYASGRLKLKATYREKLKHGLYEEWFEDGQLSVSILYSNGLKNGLSVSWYQNGQKATEGTYVDGHPIGLLQEWFEDGKLLSKMSYVHYAEESYLDGVFLIWHPDGSVSEIGYFARGVPIKEHLIYYPQINGASKHLKRAIYYSDGKLDGEQKSYYPNGSIHVIMNYLKGILHGRKALWDQTGTLIEEAYYLSGLLDGRFFIRQADGKEVISYYKNNLLSGPYEVYYPLNAQLEKVKACQTTYLNGLLDGDMIEFNSHGTKQAVTSYVKGEKEGLMTLYLPSGKVAVIVEFHQDMQNGMAYEYHSNGSIKKQVLYINDLKENEEKAYYFDGKLASLTPYCQGKINGLAKQWNKDGILIFEADYLHGKRHGCFNKYDETGAPIVMHIYQNDILINKKSIP